MQTAKSLLSRVAKVEIGEQPPDPMERSRSNGGSIWLNQPKKRVDSCRGIRLVSRKLTSSRQTIEAIATRSIFMIVTSC